MLIRAVEAGSTVEVDLCVVGGGAAGLSLAHLLEDSGLSVAVLEGGEKGYTEWSQSLYMGDHSGELLGPKSFYLTASRLRYLGGSTNHWEGWCRPLDPLDFEVRDWVSGSGWPLRYEVLAPFYVRAAALAQISPFDYSAQHVATRHQPFLVPTRSGVETTFFHVGPPTRFGAVYSPGLERSATCRLHLDANVTEIVTGESGRRVESLQVRSSAGVSYEVKARAFVLATGAIENARLLLASSRVESAGIGNRFDHVGRYFMDHPQLTNAGVIAVPGRGRSMGIYSTRDIKNRGHKVIGALRLSEAVQRQEKLLNAVVVLRKQRQSQISDLAQAVKTVAEETAPQARAEYGYFGELHITGEATPNRESRVTLSDVTDSLGVPRAQVAWRLNEQDGESIRRTAEMIAARVGRNLAARVQLNIASDEPLRGGLPSYHHMGTTRMDPDPRQGVVDTDCRVHDVSNLFVAGSSVFPIVGVSNPTLTLLALTVRLADLLKAELLA
jgi:choline dehydrogenase-like flavoprotein